VGWGLGGSLVVLLLWVAGRLEWFLSVSSSVFLGVVVLSREPVAVGFVGFDVFVLSLLGVLQVFGWVDLSGEQLAAVSAFLVAVSGVVGKLVRDHVMPMERFDEFRVAAVDYADEAFAAGFDTGLVSLVPNDLELLDGPESS